MTDDRRNTARTQAIVCAKQAVARLEALDPATSDATFACAMIREALNGAAFWSDELEDELRSRAHDSACGDDHG